MPIIFKKLIFNSLIKCLNMQTVKKAHACDNQLVTQIFLFCSFLPNLCSVSKAGFQIQILNQSRKF